MLKTLFPAVFLLACTGALASPAEVSMLGGVIPFEKPMEVAVTVIQKAPNSSSLVYWAQPLESDTVGRADVKAYIEKTRTNNAIQDPFVFQFRFAGIESALLEGTDLTHDNFKQEVEGTIQDTVEGKRFVLKCYGYFNNHIVPVCDAYDRDGNSISVALIKKGVVVPNERLGIVSEEQQRTLDAALEQAKKAEVGAWRPFHGMFRGLN